MMPVRDHVLQVAAPKGEPNQALRDMALKLVTLVAAGPSSAAFHSSVASLSPAAKQRLQAALISAAPQKQQAAPTTIARGLGQTPPTISLQNFAAHT